MAFGEGSAVADAIDASQSLETERRPIRRFAAVDQYIGWITEIPATLLVVVEVAVLFAGVVARYVLNKPLLWSDELAGRCFCGS